MQQHIVVSRLTDWARWKMNSGVALGFPSMVSFMRLGGSGNDGSDKGYGEVDSVCVETNNGVCKLPVIHHNVIKVEYIYDNGSRAAKAHRFGVSVRTYHKYLNEAHEKLGNILDLNLSSLRDNDTVVINQLILRQHQTA